MIADFRAAREDIMVALSELERNMAEHIRKAEAGERAAKYHEQWYLDQLNAAYAHMIAAGMFPDDATAEDEIIAAAEAIRREREEEHRKWLGVAS